MFRGSSELDLPPGSRRTSATERNLIRRNRRRQCLRLQFNLPAQWRRMRIGTGLKIRGCTMASSGQYPPPTAPQYPPPQYPRQYPYRRSIAGPLVLIIIGLIFLLRNLGFHLPLWHWYGRLWPLLIILWGVIKLIEYASAQRQGYRISGIGAGGILLLMLIVATGVAARKSSDYDWSGMREQIEMDDDLGGIFGTAYTFDDSLEQPFPAKGTLRVVCDHGSLNISPADDNNLRVVVHKKLFAQNQSDADKYNDGSRPQITVDGAEVRLNANTTGAGNHGVESDMDIFVPRDAAVDIAGRRGDVTINGRRADVKVSLQRGDVALDDITGSAKLSMQKGSIRASKITGDLDIEGRIDNVSVDDCGGAVHLNGDFFQDLRFSKIAKTVTFKSSRSDMEIASVPGEIEIATDSVRANEITGPSRVVTSYKDIHLEDVSGDLQVETDHHDIDVRAANKLPVGKMNLSSKHGDITLTLPANAGFQIDATTRKGDISSDFGAIKINKTNGTSQASGTVGNGAAKLQISADTGSIRIEKG